MIAEAWPSQAAAAARKEELARAAPGGVVFDPPVHSLEGGGGLLSRTLELLTPPHPKQALLPQAGALLLQEIISNKNDELGPLAVLARSWRLPAGLWRLLVEIKAAGLSAGKVDELARAYPRLGYLSRLLQLYDQSLQERDLLDQADLLAILEKRSGWLPPFLAGASVLRLRRVLWLRTLDMRLLRYFSRLIKVELEFLPGAGLQSPVEKLMKVTAGCLPEVSVLANALDNRAAPLADLALSLARGRMERANAPSPSLILARSAGYYTEVEYLLDQAEALLKSGVAAEDILLVFPSLELYGQMVRDVAGRRGLPVAGGEEVSLVEQPLVNDFLALLALPQQGYQREGLERVWQSPYLASPLSALLESPLPRHPAQVLRESRFIDGRQIPPEKWLGRFSQTAGDRFDRLAVACAGLRRLLEPFARKGPLLSFVKNAGLLLQKLRLQAALLRPPAALCVREINALHGLRGALELLASAAQQAQATAERSAGACLSFINQAVAGSALAERPGGGGRGIGLADFGQAVALRAPWVLMGGLVQGAFPVRPSARQFLSGAERLALGKAAQMPVWRTDEEEYSGQTLALAGLLSRASGGAVLSCPAGDSAGRELQPAGALAAICQISGRELPLPKGGVFGEAPRLGEVKDASSLLFQLSANLLGQAGQPGLAEAVLELYNTTPERAAAWQSLAERARREQAREALNSLSLNERAARADAFNGRLVSGQALALLGQVLANPRQRRLAPTSLESLAACPYAWFLGRILGFSPWQEPGWEVDPRQEGDWVHETLRLYFDPEAWGEEAPTALDPERLRNCLAKAAAGSAGWDKAHPMLAKARMEPLFTRLSQVVAQEGQALAGWRIRGVEKVLDGEEALKVVLPQGEPLAVPCRLDRLESRADVLRVCDYKHSGNPSLARQAADESSFGQTAFQVPLYLLAAKSAVPGDFGELMGRVVPSKVQGTGPREVSMAKNHELMAGDPPGILAAVAALWGQVAVGVFPPRPEGDTCRFCQWQGACRALPNTVGE